MEIQVNGETREFAVGLTLEGLTVALDLQPSRVAIEVNRSVVRRDQWAATTLHEGDRVEIVHFVGGGSDIMQSVPRAVTTGAQASSLAISSWKRQRGKQDGCAPVLPGRYRSRY